MAVDPAQSGTVATNEQDVEFDLDIIRGLVEVNRDAQKGFEESAENLEDSDLSDTFRRLGAERASFASELIDAYPGTDLVEEEGSILGALHRAWIGVKDAFTKGDHAILAAAEAGEDHAVKTYEKALEKDLPERFDSIVRRQYTQVKAGHDTVRELRDARS
jgi:uncharacterized protein (TIGR02284 family)